MPRRPTFLAAIGSLCAIALAACGGSDGGSGGAAPGVRPVRVHHTVALRPTCVPGGSREVRVAILMYHVVNAPPAGTPYPELWVPRARFAAQVATLARAGYQGVTLDAVDRAWRRGCRLPRKPIVLSFDDGYASQSTNAAPVLHDHGWPGVLNLAVKNIGLAGGLSRAQVRKLIGLSWEIDSHTINHLDVSTLDAAGLTREIGASRTRLRHMFGVPVDFFCYPSGRFSPAAEAAVRAAGYKGATTTQPGIASPSADRTLLPRVRVNGDETPSALLAQLHALGA